MPDTSQSRVGRATAVLAAAGLICAAATAAYSPAAAQTRRSAGASPAASSATLCASWKHHGSIASTIAKGLASLLRGLPSNKVAIEVHDPYLGVGCWYNDGEHFYSASVVKATILAALLLKAHEQHRALTSYEQSEAWNMITLSDNAAATYLWNDVGMSHLQHFLNRAGMTHTVLNTWGAWGLTEITARDETTLLDLLFNRNTVLTYTERKYELYLMNHVVSYESWGVRAGAPRKFTWHIKNGWAPLPYVTDPWYVHSIGCFLYKNEGYSIVVLTRGNSSTTPGIDLIEEFARVINHGLNPQATAVWPPSTPDPRWNIPDEIVPPRPSGH